jgi:opacity protein-like surface antigen
MKSVLVVALLCASTVTATAQDDPKWNTGLRGSLAFNGSIDAKANATPPVTAKADLDIGGGASVFYGLSLPSGFDAELELMYRYMPLGDGTVNGVSAKLGGYAQMFAPIANIYWTLPVGFPVKPYVGGGVGYAWNDAGLNAIGASTFDTIHDQAWHLVYNLMAGIAIPAGNGARYTVGYRWLHEDIGISCGSSVACSGKTNSNSIEVGLVLDL